MKMIIFTISIALFSVFILILNIRRLFRIIQINKIEKQVNSNQTFFHKIMVIKHKDLFINVHTILWITGSIVLILLSLTGMLFYQRNVQIKTQFALEEVEETLHIVVKRQSALLSLPIFQYPELGLGLTSIDWPFFVTEENYEKRFETEVEIARSLTPILGRATVIISNNVSQNNLSLAIHTEIAAMEANDLLEMNSAQLAKELSEIEELGQVSIQILDIDTNQYLFNQTYIKEESGALSLIGSQ